MSTNKSKTKIYYWLKFDKHFFDNLFIKRLLRNFPGGSDMIVIYIRLMLEAIENDCVIDYEGTFDNYAEELALRLETSEEQINMTLAYFVKCGVIQVDNDGNTHYPQAKALLGQETNWNRYKKKQAELEKKQESWKNSNHIPTDSKFVPTEIETEIEEEQELKLEIEQEEENREKIDQSSSTINRPLSKLYKDFESNFGRLLSPIELDDIKDMYQNFSSDLVFEALKIAISNGKPITRYIAKILHNWKLDGVTTVEQVRLREEERNKKYSKGQNVPTSSVAQTNVPDWADKPVEKREPTAEEKARLEEFKAQMMSREG